MARYYYSGARNTVEGAQTIRLPWLKKQGYFASGGGYKSGNVQWSRNGEPTGNINIAIDSWSDSPKITFSYRTRNNWAGDEEWRSMNYSFNLEKIPCRYGGVKWFIRCGLTRSGVYCGRRVRTLYSVGGYYGCRICADLSYDSCNESKRGFPFNILTKAWKADEMYGNLKRKFYKGKPTRKYRQYLRLSGDEVETSNALVRLEKMLRS